MRTLHMRDDKKRITSKKGHHGGHPVAGVSHLNGRRHEPVVALRLRRHRRSKNVLGQKRAPGRAPWRTLSRRCLSPERATASASCRSALASREHRAQCVAVDTRTPRSRGARPWRRRSGSRASCRARPVGVARSAATTQVRKGTHNLEPYVREEG